MPSAASAAGDSAGPAAIIAGSGFIMVAMGVLSWGSGECAHRAGRGEDPGWLRGWVRPRWCAPFSASRPCPACERRGKYPALRRTGGAPVAAGGELGARSWLGDGCAWQVDGSAPGGGLQRQDLNLRPPGYGPGELTNCSTLQKRQPYRYEGLQDATVIVLAACQYAASAS